MLARLGDAQRSLESEPLRPPRPCSMQPIVLVLVYFVCESARDCVRCCSIFVCPMAELGFASSSSLLPYHFDKSGLTQAQPGILKAPPTNPTDGAIPLQVARCRIGDLDQVPRLPNQRLEHAQASKRLRAAGILRCFAVALSLFHAPIHISITADPSASSPGVQLSFSK